MPVLNKLLVRIIVGLVAFFFALGLFSYCVTSLINQTRLEHYWSDLVTPPLNYLVNHQDMLVHVQAPALSLVAKNQSTISSLIETRLHAGQVVFNIGEDGRFRAWVAKVAPGLLLELEASPTGEEIYQLYLRLIEEMLQQSVAEDAIGEIEQALLLSVEIVPVAEYQASEKVMAGLAQSPRYLLRDSAGITGLLRLPDAQLAKIIFPPPFVGHSWFVLLLLVLSGIGLLALLVFFMLRGWDRQLRNVETVASRIARGELDARVKSSDSGDAVSRLGGAFNSMADHIQRLMFVQKEMIHAVSHELRTPVARIRFGVQMIEDCPDQEAMRKQVKGIDGDIQELDELIDEILTYARLEQGGPILAFQEANIVDIVEQVVNEQSSTKPDMKISAEYKPGSEVWKESEVEARYIHRSIQNLVGNATRYASSTVSIVCSFDKETCRVDVEDDGPGIPEDQWESVFTPFARLDDSRTRSSGGYGLGLSIVRRILYWHGGQAFLGRSTLGGAKFSLVWPRRQDSNT